MRKTSLALDLWLLVSAVGFTNEMLWLGTQVDHSSGYRRALYFAVGQPEIGPGNFGGKDSLLRIKAGTY